MKRKRPGCKGDRALVGCSSPEGAVEGELAAAVAATSIEVGEDESGSAMPLGPEGDVGWYKNKNKRNKGNWTGLQGNTGQNGKWVAGFSFWIDSRFWIQMKDIKLLQIQTFDWIQIGWNQFIILGTFQIWKLKLDLNIQI
jgi:hypothetical protein